MLCVSGMCMWGVVFAEELMAMASPLASRVSLPCSTSSCTSNNQAHLPSTLYLLAALPQHTGAISCHVWGRRKSVVLVAAAAAGSGSGSGSGSVADEEKASTSLSYEEREKSREERRRKSFEEYEALKQELSNTTVKVAVAVDAYILLTLSPQTAISYGIGAVGSYLYLQLLYRYADSLSEDSVADIFQRRKVKKIGIRSSDVQESLEKFIRGCTMSLSSPRLAIPAALYFLWAFSTHFTGTSSDSFHLEVAPLMLGFFAYKAAALIQAYRDNKDLLLVISTDDPDSLL